MGNKIVCLDCKKSFNQGTDFKDKNEIKCQDCGKQMILLPHRFRPPKKTDSKKWETIKFLIENGFYFQHIYESTETSDHINRLENYAAYPNNLREAKDFVVKYKNQAIK